MWLILLILHGDIQFHADMFSQDICFFLEIRVLIRRIGQGVLNTQDVSFFSPPPQEAIDIDSVSGMIRTSTLLDRNLYEVINFGVIAEDVNIDKTTQAIQTATGKYSQTYV